MPGRVSDLNNVHKAGGYTFTYAEAKSSNDLYVYDVDKLANGEAVHVTVPVRTGDDLGLHISAERADWGRFHVAFDHQWNVPFGADGLPGKERGEAEKWYDEASDELEAMATAFLQADAAAVPDDTADNDNAPQQYQNAMPLQGYPQVLQYQNAMPLQGYPQVPQYHGGYDPYAAQYGYDQNAMYGQQPYAVFDQSGLFIPTQQQAPVQAQPMNLSGQPVAGAFVPGVGMVYAGPLNYQNMMYGTGLVVQADGRARAATPTEVAQAQGT
jgi:hypothetical protein